VKGMAINLRFEINTENFSTRRGSNNFERKTLLHEVTSMLETNLKCPSPMGLCTSS
jgi:hypothetical protein